MKYESQWLDVWGIDVDGMVVHPKWHEWIEYYFSNWVHADTFLDRVIPDRDLVINNYTALRLEGNNTRPHFPEEEGIDLNTLYAGFIPMGACMSGDLFVIDSRIEDTVLEVGYISKDVVYQSDNYDKVDVRSAYKSTTQSFEDFVFKICPQVETRKIGYYDCPIL